ncbi:MAG: uroporphyrinogen decarboxylase family protein [Candidatus Thorarchaeota archaeon]
MSSHASATSPLSLVESVLNHETPERTPVVPIVGLASAEYSGHSVRALLTDADVQAKSLVSSLRRFNYDGVFTVMDLTMEVEALGGEVHVQEKAPPYVAHPLTCDPSAILEIEPVSLSSGRIGVFTGAARRLVNEVGNSHLVSSYVIGPFTMAGQLIGLTKLLELTIDQESMTERVVKHCSHLVTPLIEMYGDIGVHNVVLLEPSASSSVMSPQYFMKYSMPYLTDCVRAIHETGARATVHVCGKAGQILSYMAQTGADILSIDSPVDLVMARTVVSRQCVLLGNVDTTLMLAGLPDAILQSARRCIGDTGGNSFILSTGCDVPIGTPTRNIEALVRSVHAHTVGHSDTSKGH